MAYGLSIGYRILKSRPDGHIQRLQKLELFEISLVAIPANSYATVTLVKSPSVKGQLNLDGDGHEIWTEADGGTGRSRP